MRAVTVTHFGGPDVLQVRKLPAPLPQPDELLIDVTVASVLWVETMIRRTGGRPFFTVEPPYVPGNGVGGVVRAVGAQVDPAWIGRPVVGHTGGGGGYAESIALPVSAVSLVPAPLTIEQAAALLHDGVTARSLLAETGVGAGDRVLVVGASGGLGIVSVQLARARGARVVATARDPRKLSRVREIGADTVVDTDLPAWWDEARAALGGGGADVILDNIGGALGEAAFGLIADGGRFSAHGTPSGRFAEVNKAEAARRRVTVSGIGDVQLDRAVRKQLTDDVLSLAAAGVVRNVVGQTFPLSDAGKAHAAIEARTVFGATQLVVGRQSPTDDSPE